MSDEDKTDKYRSVGISLLTAGGLSFLFEGSSRHTDSAGGYDVPHGAITNPALGTSSSAELHADNLNGLEGMQKPQDIACTGTDRITVLPRLGSIRSLPFLAQYLAQAIIAPDETPASRWRAGNGAYRLAATQAEAAPRQLVLDA